MLPEPVLDLLRRQHGVVATFQLGAVGLSRGIRQRIYGAPEFERATPRVLCHRAAPWSVAQQLTVGVLDAGPGGVLWGKSAAAHWGFGPFPPLPVHVAVRRRSDIGDRLGQVHLVRHLGDDDVTSHLDVRTARPEVVVLWLAGMWTHRFGHELALERTAAVLDDAWRQRLIDERFLHELADRSGGRGRSGIVVLRSLLEERRRGYTPAGSRLEERFESLVPPDIRDRLRRQVAIETAKTPCTVDFGLDTWPLLVEINGEAVHTSLSAREADEERYRRLLEAGFSVVVFWEGDIWYRPSTIKQEMNRLFANPDPHPTVHRPTKAPWEH